MKPNRASLPFFPFFPFFPLLPAGLACLILAACAPVQTTRLAEIDSAVKEAKADSRSSVRDDVKSLARDVGEQLSARPQLSLQKPDKAEERRFDLNARDLAAPSVYQVLVESSPYNLILPASIREPVTISLRDVTLAEALVALREAYGFEFEFKGRNLVVSKETLVTRSYTVNYLLGSRQGRSEVKVMSGSIDTGSPSSSTNPSNPSQPQSPPAPSSGQSPPREASRVTTVVQNDFWQVLASSLTSMVGSESGRNVILNPQAGLVIVKALPREQREVESYLKKVQGQVGRQVMLEAKIIEVTLKNEFQSGVNWASFDQFARHRFSVGANTSSIGMNGATSAATALSGAAGLFSQALGPLGMAFTTGSFSALMSFLETQGGIQVLSTPRVATLNNQKAVLKVGSDDFFVTNVSTTTTSSGTSTVSSPTISVQPFFSGIALDVTPQIDSDGSVTLHVHPSVSEVSEKTKVIDLGQMGTYKLPLASSSVNETDSIVKVNDGHIVALGGLMSVSQDNSTSGVPGVSEIPLAGELFRNTSRRSVKKEMVLLIRPTVINSNSDWASSLSGVGEIK